VGSQGGARRLFVVGRAAEREGEAQQSEPPLPLSALLEGVGGVASEPCAAGILFCERLKRDGYAHLSLPRDAAQLLLQTEKEVQRWFAQTREEKMLSAGAYGPASGTLAGYASGRDREQLELRLTVDGGHIYPRLLNLEQFDEGHCTGSDGGSEFAALTVLLTRSMRMLDGWARAMIEHVACDLGVRPAFFADLLDPALATDKDVMKVAKNGCALSAAEGTPSIRLDPDRAHEECPPLRHAGLRACRYRSDAEGCAHLADGRRVLCPEHNDVGLLTLDFEASEPGLQAFRQSDRQWVSLEGGMDNAQAVNFEDHDNARLITVMVGDTLAAISGGLYTSCRHRVLAPMTQAPTGAGERIGLPFLFRCRGEAVIDTREERRRTCSTGRASALAELEATKVDDLPTADCPQALANYIAWRRKYCK